MLQQKLYRPNKIRSRAIRVVALPKFTVVRYGSLADIASELGMSALPLKADVLIVGINVRYVPEADINQKLARLANRG